MNKLVIHHTYAHGMTFDVSNNQNHGIGIAVTPGYGPFSNSFYFQKGDSRINVLPSRSLQNLYAIRAKVHFYLSPVGSWHRFNLIEGHLSFALFVNHDGSVQGTILDNAEHWTGAISQPSVVVPNRWHQIEFQHDGVSHCQISLDGTLVGSAYDVPGPVRSVGPEGVTIGHWPGQPGTYTFEGHIGAVQLYKYDPIKDLEHFLDPCCIDGEALDKVVLQLRAKGWNGEQLRTYAYKLLTLATVATAALRGGDPAKTEELKQITRTIVAAFLRHDAAGVQSAADRILKQVAGNLTSAQIKQFSEQFAALVQQLPLETAEWLKLARALCLDHAIIRHPTGATDRPGGETEH